MSNDDQTTAAPTTDTPSGVDDSFVADLIAYIADEVADGDEPVEADTDLLLTGLVDSLGVVMIVGWIEARTGAPIDPADVVLEHFQTVDAMTGYLRTR